MSHSAAATAWGAGSSVASDAAEIHVQLPRAQQRGGQQRSQPARHPGARGARASSRLRPSPARPAPARAGRSPRGRCGRAGAASSTSSCAITRPGLGESTATRSASSDRLLDVVGHEHDRPRLAREGPARATPASRARVIASSAPNGSSRHSTGLPESSVRRNATRWRIPPGELVRVGPLEALQPELCEQRGRAAARPRAREPGDAQRQRGVVDGAQPRQQQVALGHQHRGRARDRAAVGQLQPADQLEQRALAAAARPDHRQQLAAGGAQGDAGERLHRRAVTPTVSCGSRCSSTISAAACAARRS